MALQTGFVDRPELWQRDGLNFQNGVAVLKC